MTKNVNYGPFHHVILNTHVKMDKIMNHCIKSVEIVGSKNKCHKWIHHTLIRHKKVFMEVLAGYMCCIVGVFKHKEVTYYTTVP